MVEYVYLSIPSFSADVCVVESCTTLFKMQCDILNKTVFGAADPCDVARATQIQAPGGLSPLWFYPPHVSKTDMMVW